MRLVELRPFGGGVVNMIYAPAIATGDADLPGSTRGRTSDRFSAKRDERARH
jgi:hypothetical protein